MSDNTWNDAEGIFPAEHTLVLLWDGKTYGFGRHDLQEGWEMRSGMSGVPTHWAYLPEPPK
jgi:hypothetical protein